jgi:hypothetical protein
MQTLTIPSVDKLENNENSSTLPVRILIGVNIITYLLICNKLSGLKFKNFARHQWLTPVILVTWKAEIRRNKVQGQPGQIV